MKKRTLLICIIGLVFVIGTKPVQSSEPHHSPTQTCDSHHKEESKKTEDYYKIGAQVRVRGDFVRNQNLGDFSFSPGTDDEQIVSRTRLGASLKPTDKLNIFIQGQFYSRENHSDYSKTNLYQAYLELLRQELIPFDIKIGRQDLCYGSGFFLGINDFYDGLIWDGIKARAYPLEHMWIDIIGARYVKLNRNTSDDEPALYGAYSSYELMHETDLDLYFFYHKGGFKFFHTDLPDSPRWFTFGTRIAGNIKKRIDYEIEPLYQFGKIDNPKRTNRDTINAYGGHVEAGYTFDLKEKPRLFTGYAFGSGDSKTEDKTYREFHGNIYNDNYIVGDISLIPDLSGITVASSRASGMHVFIGGLSLNPNPKLNLNLDNHYFLADKTPSGISKQIGDEVNLVVTYKLLDNISIMASANRFFMGDFFKETAGSDKDIDYFYVQTQIEF